MAALQPLVVPLVALLLLVLADHVRLQPSAEDANAADLFDDKAKRGKFYAWSGKRAATADFYRFAKCPPAPSHSIIGMDQNGQKGFMRGLERDLLNSGNADNAI